MLRVILSLLPSLPKAIFALVLLGSVVFTVDKFCNQEKRVLKKTVAQSLLEIQGKNVSIRKLNSEITRLKEEHKQTAFDMLINCKQTQRIMFEDPYVDLNATLFF